MPNRILSLVPRREQDATAQTIEKKKIATALLPKVAAELTHRWLWQGQSIAQMSRNLGINNRELVERAIRNRLAPRNQPISAPIRRVA